MTLIEPVNLEIPATQTLSSKDEHILSLLLGKQKNEESRIKTIVDLKLPPDQHVAVEEVERYVAIEKKAIQLEQNGNITEALQMLDELIAEAPKYASAYNNRAQMRRLQLPDISIPREAISDLESAIALARPAKPHACVSKMQAQVLRNAYGQLAAIYIQQAKRRENAPRSWDLQLKASDMMVEASNYGEQIAASLAVSLNPYAKLCGNMVETVLGSYR